MNAISDKTSIPPISNSLVFKVRKLLQPNTIQDPRLNSVFHHENAASVSLANS